MIDENDNIITVCNDCVEKRKKQVVHNYKIGDLIKKRFVSKDGERELMWVIIKEIYPEKIIGILDNKPLGDFEIKCGDQVEVKKTEIIQVLELDTQGVD